MLYNLAIVQLNASKRRGPKGDDFTRAQLYQIATMLQQGRRVREILQTLGVKERTFYARLRRQNMVIREMRVRFLVDATTWETILPEEIPPNDVGRQEGDGDCQADDYL